MKQISFDTARDQAGLLFRPLLISAMVTCIAAAWVWILESAFAPWRGSYLILIVFAVTLDSLLVERQLQRRRFALQEPRTWQIRFAEIGITVLLVKAGSYSSSGWQGLARDVSRWIVEPESFLDLEFIIGILFVGMLWLLSLSIAGNLAEIEDETNLRGEPEAARSSLQEQFLVGAMFLLFAVGMQRLALSPAGVILRPAQVGGLAALPIVYVGLGLLLFGQVRLSLLRAHWTHQQVPVASGIERRWAGWSVLFVAGISAVALLLPAGETSLGVYLLTYIASIFLLVGQLFGFLMYLLITLLFLPFAFLRGQSVEAPQLPQLPSMPTPAETGSTPDWLASTRPLIVGVVVVLFAFLIMRTYWRDRQASGIWKAIGDMLREAWNALRAWLLGSARHVQRIWSRTPSTRGAESPHLPFTWWRAWRARTLNGRVRRLYLALLERAARVGHARRPAQTPFEYLTDLQPHVTDIEGLATLTDAFVQARYSRKDFTAAQVSVLHRVWQRLRDELRRH